MPIINLLSQSNPDKSIDENSSSLINMYLTESSQFSKYALVAYPTPGLTSFSTGTTKIRALFSIHNITYGIDGNNFFSVNSSGTRTSIGTLNTSTGWAKIRGIKDQLFIADNSNGYWYKITANTFGTITDVNFPTAIQDIECQDEFGLVIKTNTQTWFASAISDLTTWPVLSFASTTGNQNFNNAIVSVHRELYIMGTQTTEVWDNLGNANFTFGRNTSVFIEYGCPATASVAKGDNSLFFLAQNPSGGSVVMRMQGLNPIKISNRGIDYQISTYTTISDAIGFCYYQEGHEFYVLTFPTAGVTWVYDTSTGAWHQRQSLVGGNQVQWVANCYTFNYNKCLIGDSNTGTIFQLDMTVYKEGTQAITRTIVTHPFYAGGAWMRMEKLQVDFDTQPGAALSNWNLYISRDGGRTFGTAKPASPQQDANGMYRVYWLRLGQAHSYVCKLQTNANMQTIILGAWANINSNATPGEPR